MDAEEETLTTARHAFRSGDAATAESAFQSLVGSKRFTDHGLYGVGMVWLRLRGDPVVATTYFDQMLARDAGSVDAHYRLGQIAQERGALDESERHYQIVMARDSAHKGTLEALSALSKARSRSSPAVVVPPDQSTPAESTTVDDSEDLGVYGFLVNDKSPLSSKSIELIRELRIVSKRPSMMAYLGELFPALMILIVGMVDVWFLISRYSLRSSDMGLGLLIALAGVCSFIFLEELLSVRSVRIRVDRGRLQFERGVFSSRLVNVELWRVTKVEIRRNFFDQFTQYGSIILEIAHENDHVEVRGLARGNDFQAYYQQLLNLVASLRSNPVVKGVVS